MKSTVLISALFMCFSSLFGQIQPIVSIESGYSKKVAKIYYEDDRSGAPKYNKEGQYTNIELGAKYKGFKMVANNITYMKFSEQSFSPYLSVYDFNFSYTYKALEVGYFHECIHKSVSDKSYDNIGLFGGEDRLFVKWTIK